MREACSAVRRGVSGVWKMLVSRTRTARSSTSLGNTRLRVSMKMIALASDETLRYEVCSGRRPVMWGNRISLIIDHKHSEQHVGGEKELTNANRLQELHMSELGTTCHRER